MKIIQKLTNYTPKIFTNNNKKIKRKGDPAEKQKLKTKSLFYIFKHTTTININRNDHLKKKNIK